MELISNEKLVQEIITRPTPLSDEQKKAVLSENKYLRIVAGAGTGKTETMTRRIAYLLLCKGVAPDSIVAFTFTEKAAQSLRSRIYERVKELGGQERCWYLGNMFIGTIHSFCFHLLADKFDYGDYSPLDENKEMAFLMREGWNLGLGNSGNYGENCERFLRSVNVVYNELIDRDELKSKANEFAEKLEKYEEILKQHRLIDFGQMISMAVDRIQRDPKNVGYINYLIVDEYQDINRAQDKLIKLIGKHASVFIVGDPRQCIYQWRGSDERCFEEFLQTYKECDQVTIKENWRSVPEIVKVANYFAESFGNARYEPLQPMRKENGLAVIINAKTPDSEANWVISQIKKLIKNNKDLRYKDFAILLRSVKTSGRPFIEKCKEEEIPFIVAGKIGLFQRDEAQAVGKLFAWLDKEGFWIRDFYQNDKIKGDDLFKSALESWRKAVDNTVITANIDIEFQKWKECVLNNEYSNFTYMYHDLLIRLGVLNLHPENKLDAAILANLGRFNTILTDYETSVRLGGKHIDWPTTIKGLCWFMNSYAIGAYEENYEEDLRGIDAVQIMTVHQAKGLEWPVVFIPCLTEKRFPSSNTGKRQEWYLPREAGLFQADRYEGDIEDEKRLFYVAITRARDLLCLSYFKKIQKTSRSEQRPSAFLNEVSKINYSIIDDDRDIKSIKICAKDKEEELQTFSATELIYYRRCPFRYRLSKLWNFQPGLDVAIGFGRSLHFCLQNISHLVKDNIEPEKAVDMIIDRYFYLPYATKTVFESMKNKARQILRDFVKENINELIRVEQVETTVEFPFDKIIISGKIDAIIKKHGPEERIEIRDYKTSDKVDSFDDTTLQLQIYALGLSSIGKKVSEASVAYLDNEEKNDQKIKTVPVDESSLKNAEYAIKNCLEDIKKSIYQGKIGNQCNLCDYKKICFYINSKR
ncbi:TPA: ATP-dependent helicase [Candidatus Poribacteria bacterium]|nr:ATP-dependent helicase [Candidatus Poribacteria bacterium]